MPAARKDLTGMKFGRLTVLQYAYSKKYAYWRCKCDCGRESIVRSSHLLLGAIKTCGCSRSENGKKTVVFAQKSNTKYGEIAKSRLYTIWNSMKERCADIKNKDYGGRGIEVCRQWLEDYRVFYDWAMANDYSDDLSIDRINNDKGYFPENCRWSSRVIQANNTHKNVYITYNGETLSYSQWARKLNISLTSFRRLLKKGYKFEDILARKYREREKIA
jgi:hypothetical protein